MRPTRRAVLAATVSSIALAGCTGDGTGTADPGDGGSGNDGETPTQTSTATPSPSPSPTSTATPGSTDSPTPTASGTTVQVRSHPDLGEVLVDSEGRTLYMFASDTRGEGASTCSGGCANAWPPLTVEETATAGEGVTAGLTTFEREDGSTQVAADGWPLYYFASDENPGDANGQGANDVWWVLRPDGTPVRPGTSTATATPTDAADDGGGGGY